MKKGVMMQGFEWYLPSSPHLWKILRINAFKLKKAGILQLSGFLLLIKVHMESMIQDMVSMIIMT